MGSNMKRVSVLLVAAVMIAGLSVPMVAVAAPSTSRSVAKKSAATARLRVRIAGVLRARKTKFNVTFAGLSKGISSLETLTDKVARAGGDVSKVRVKLASAKRHLARARSREQAAVGGFNSIASSTNRAAALSRARSRGRLTTAELKLARSDLKSATTALRAVVKRVRATSVARAANG